MDGAVWVSLRAFQLWVEGCTATDGGVQPQVFCSHVTLAALSVRMSQHRWAEPAGWFHDGFM